MNRSCKRILAAVLTWALLLGIMPRTVLLPVRAEGTETVTNPLAGKTISILGASISTFAGTSNGAAADSTNSTIRNNAEYYPHSVVTDVKLTDTWWMQVAEDLDLRLLVNNSWSGSSLLYERNGTVGAYVDRCVQLHDDTGDNAGEVPDIIGIQMGTNDFQYYKDTLGTADIDYEALITENGDGTYIYATPATSLEAAAIVLHKISVRYPDAEVYYLNISQRVDGTDELIRSFNAELKQVVEHFDAHIVDIYGSAITMADFDTYIGDGRVHPNCLGMDAYTEAFKRALLENTAYPVKTHKVSLKLDGVTADYGDDKIVVSGSDYTVNLATAAEMGLDVTVTMGSRDVTAAVYANGRVTIDSVTDEVTITAKSVYEPKDYRWEFDGVDLVGVCGDNVLTKNAGTTTEDVFHKTRYALERQIFLLHDLPWVVEWKCEGTFLNENGSSGARLFTSDDVNANYNARYIFKNNTNGIVAMGEKTTSGSHNYGVALADYDIDWTAEHTYRLENRIFPDGGNMVYLFVDGKEIGSMNHYYVGTKDQNATSDWLSGKDFVFPYMGTDTHGFTNCSIDYIAVWEGGKSFAGKTISILGDSISTYTGVSNDANANASLAGGAIYYTPGKQGVYQADTWWQQVIDSLDMELCVNNSWSGSSVLHTRRGTEGAYVNRCIQLHNDKTGEEPDIIVVYMGGNDFNYYQDTLGTADIDYDTLIVENGDGTITYAQPATTCEAYAILLHKMQIRYPNADIYCMTSLPRRDPDKEDDYPDLGQPTDFNAERKKIAEYFGCTVVDIENCGIAKEAEIFDQFIGDGRTHPNAEGMDLIAQALVSALLGRETKLYDISGTYTGVQSDNTAAAAAEGMAYTAKLTMANGYSDLQVVVTMGGVDVTKTAYADGTVHIEAVTGDVEITATAQRDPMEFRWGMVDGQLVSTGKTENSLAVLAGTITDGVISDGRYQFAIPVILKHDRPWELEWKCAEDWRGVVLSENPPQLAAGRCYLTRTKGGQLCFGTWTGAQYNNYGIDLSGLDDQTHTYRLENRIAADGSNMVWLYLDGAEIGAMNNYYVGSNSQNATSDWLSGRDFEFSYIGSDSTTLNNCDLDYIQVWEDGEQAESLPLRYDDHYDISGKTVEIVDAGKPTSFQVGYGVAENSVLDTAVVTLEGNKLIATGIGTAKVKIDGETYEVTVEAAPISLLLLAGQSNMRGSEGNANQSIVCPDGMVYSTYGDDRGESNTAMSVSNARQYAPSALTGAYCTVNVEGTTDCLSGYPVHSLTEAGAGKIGPDSGFAYEWAQQTGEKVWVVNAAHGGTSINVWQPGTKEYEECQALFTACTETLRKEIAAGHFTLNHMGYFWCQGCSDRAQSAKWYVDKYLAMHEALKTELAFDHDSDSTTAVKTFEFGGIIPVRVGSTSKCYRDGVNTDSNPYAYHESFVDLRMSGPRVAQYWMGNNSELEDIWTVCTIGDDWVWMPDGTNGVSDYFNKHYANGTVDYQPQVAQSASWYTPTTPKAVHDSVHYNQIGYNEIGRESVRNALIMLGEIEAPEVETSVKLLTWDGYSEANEVTASTKGNSGTLVVPVVCPVWKSKEVTYELSEGLSWDYYDLLASSAEGTGTLTVSGGYGNTVTVVKADPYTHFADHLSQLPDGICSEVNLWSILEHDEYYFASGTNWGIYGGREVPSVTIFVKPGDQIFATSFGKAGENGHATSSGIRVTFFRDYGIAKTMTPAETYAEFDANGGYLIAPEGAVAINIAMWDNSDTNEIYILNAPHNYDAVVTAPTCTEQGYTTYTCACGDSYVDDVSMDITDRFKWNEGYVISAFNGNMMADKNWVASDYVDISAFESIEIVTGDTVNANTTLGIAFYDANKKFVSGVVHTDKTGTEYGILVHNLEVPQGVSYLRTTWYSVNHGSYNGATLHTFYCKGAGTAIPPLGHDYVLTEETKPNCSAGGTKVYICSRCGESTQETTSKGDHAYDNGICIGCGSSILGNDWIAPNFAEGDYSMVVLPDTQKLVTSWEDTYYEQMQWIADNEDALNIQAVLHMGDMVDNNTAREWTICEAGTDILQNAGIPWMPMRGNHDDADYFNNYYDYTTYGTNQSWFGGAYHSDKLEHTYWFVTVGQREYMILSLGWAPSWDVLAWAQDIVEAHSDKNVILTCHAYMNSDGTLLDSSDAHCPSSYHPGYPDGDDVWDAFKGYENVVLAMGGHIHSANIVTFVDQNGTGRDVPSLLVDRQNDDMANHYGMVAVLTFHNGSNTVDVNWYSVRYDALYRAKNQFSIDVPHVHSHEYVADITVPTCTEGGYTTHTCTVCGDSYVDSYVDAVGHTEVSDPAVQPTISKTGLTSGTHCGTCRAVLTAQEVIPARGYDWMLEDGKFKILLIGNSFSEDASNGSHTTTSQMLDILQAMLGGDVKVTIGLCYSGGKGLNWHATQSEQGNSSYSLRVISSESGKWKSYGSYTSANALQWTDWDVVSLQHYEINTTTGKESNAYPDQVDPKFDRLKPATEFMLDYVDQYAPNAAVYFYMHWARAYNATLNESLATYNKMAVFFPEVVDYTGTESRNRFETIIPVGLSVQNARTTYLALLKYNTTAYADGNLNLNTDAQIGLQRDGGHLSFNVGRYIAALTFAETIIPEELRANSYVLPDIRVTESVGRLPKEYTVIAQKSVLAAVNSWKNGNLSEVVTIDGYTEDPTVTASECVQKMTLSVDCAGSMDALKAAITDQVLKATGPDFAVDAVTLPADFSVTQQPQSFTAAVTIRFGYTSTIVEISGTKGSHNYTAAVTPPTCTEQGYTTYTCTVCGDSYVADYVEAAGHSYEATVTYPVGLTKGYTDYTCTSCADTYRTVWLDAAAYEGKTIACVGDSITAAYGVTKDQTDYVYLLAKQLGMDYIRLGDSGTTLCTDGSRTCNIRRLTENNLQGADIVTIAMGINDFCAAAEGYYELGDINSTDTSTIYGAARMWCERIAELRKTDSLSHTQFYFVTPVITSWNNSVTSARDWDQSKENIHGYTLRDLCNAIIEVAALYDVPVIDLNLISGLYYNSADDNNIDVFGGDGVHPGVNGHAMMAAALANALLQNDLRDDHTHTYGSWIITKYPGCEDGEEKHVCSICTATESRALDATGHSYHSVVTDPTCTEQGYTTYTCHCGDSYVDDYVDATGHSYGEWYEVDAPACTTAGEDRRDCDDCDHYETRVVDALGHDLKQHEAKEPTCVAVGWKAYETCSRCDYTTYAELAATGHDHKASVTVPTCTEQGYTTYTCHCGDSYVADYVDATGHSYGEWYEVDAPVCTTAGEDRRDCDDCDHYETRVVDALGHDLKQHEAKEPTCTAVGWKAYETCSRCDYTTYAELAATGHDHKASVTAPTCTEQGYTTYTCHCGDSYVDSYVDALGHDYEAVITEPTYTEAGYTTYTCTVCGSSYVGDHTDPLPYLKGDLDGNEVTNTDDAIYLLYHAFFGEELYPVNQPCDFDANGSVNTDDAIYLLYHAFFGEQLYPLH